jgi:hypothetical protein
MSLKSLHNAAVTKSCLPRSLVVESKFGEKGQDTVFYRDLIFNAVSSHPGADAPVEEQFDAALLYASNLAGMHKEMALRGLKMFLFGGSDRQNEVRIDGAFDMASMIEMFDSGEVDGATFALIQDSWNEFTYPTNGGRFAPIGDCYIMGSYPMQPLSPVLPVFDKNTQADELTPVNWKAYGDHFLNREQANEEDADEGHKNNHILRDMIAAVKRAQKA